MSCPQFEDSYDLYVLGALDEGEARELREHLQTGCQACEAELRKSASMAQQVSSTAEVVEPPARLRERIRGAIAPRPPVRRTPSVWPWLLAAAATIALLAVLLHRTPETDPKVAKMLEILAAPGTRELQFADPSKGVQGSLYIHRKIGMALVVEKLPAPPPGWVYESWLVPKQGAPRPVESFDANKRGQALSIAPGPLPMEELSAMAVSMERTGKPPSKPTAVVLSARVS